MRHTRGFTLLEVLVAMGVLFLIVLMVAELFSQATKAVDQGQRRADVMLAGRAITDYVKTECEAAVLDGQPLTMAGFPVMRGRKPIYIAAFEKRTWAESGRSGEGLYWIENGTNVAPLYEWEKASAGQIFRTYELDMTVTFLPVATNPTHAEITLEVAAYDGGRHIDTWPFRATAFLHNAKRDEGYLH